jgi:hypothetical protein
VPALHQLPWNPLLRRRGSPIALSLALAIGLSACDEAPTSPDSSSSPDPSAPAGDGVQAAIAASAGAPYKVSILFSKSDGTYGTVWDGGKYIQPPYGDKGTLATSRFRYPSILALRSSSKVTAVKMVTSSSYFSEGGEVTERAFYGSYGTFLADINNDKLDDLIAVNGNTTTVKLGEGRRFATTDIDWSRGPFYGDVLTAFADVTGDGWADGIAVRGDGVYVSRGLGTCFFSCGDLRLSTVREKWTKEAYWGQRGTHFADVTGDSLADAIVVNDGGVVVRRAKWSPYVGNGGGYALGENEYWTDDRYYGNLGPVRFQDWNSDGYVDAIVVNDWGITVRLSDGHRFQRNKTITGPFYGDNNTLFVHLNGDKYLDIVALNR